MPFTRFTLDQMLAATDLGATLEFDYLSCSPKWRGAVPPRTTAQAIQAVGFEHCVLGSDGGQTYNPEPPDMLRAFCEALASEGVRSDLLKAMLSDVPARLLDI
jgi:hypothetical protein